MGEERRDVPFGIIGTENHGRRRCQVNSSIHRCQQPFSILFLLDVTQATSGAD